MHKITLIDQANWFVTFLCLIFIFACVADLLRKAQVYAKIKVFISTHKTIVLISVLSIFAEAFLVLNIPLREGYDNYHGIGINISAKFFKEIVATQIISGMNWFLGYRILNNLIFNYILSAGCAILLAAVAWHYFKNVFVSFSAFFMLIFSPASLLLVKTIGSAHLNLFFLLLSLVFLLTLNVHLSGKKQDSASFLWTLAVLLPVMNNVRQEFLFFLAPFIMQTFYLVIVTGFYKENKKLIFSLVLCASLLFAFFCLFQSSLGHHNQPRSYISIARVFSHSKFSLFPPEQNVLFGVVSMLSVIYMAYKKKYFLGAALFLWLLLSSNIYSYSGSFPLMFLRHELYLSLPYILCAVASIFIITSLFTDHFKPIVLSVLTVMHVCYLSYAYLIVGGTRAYERTTDKVLQFLHTSVPLLPKNRVLIAPNVADASVSGLFFYTRNLYYGRPKDVHLEKNIPVILYYPEGCSFPNISSDDIRACQEFKSCLGSPFAKTVFDHRPNLSFQPGSEGILLETGFYELNAQCHDKVYS